MNYEFIAQKVGEIVGEKTEYVKVAKGKRLLHGIVIGNGNVRPTIYVDDFEDYFDTEEEIANAIVECYERMPKTPKLELNDLPIMEFEKLQDKIFPCLVNKGAFIDESVITRAFFDDIEICYRIFLDIEITDRVSVSSILVKKEILKLWNVSADDLHKIAISNLNEKEYYFDDMIKIIAENVDLDEETKKDMSGMMFLLSNKNKMYGANNLLNAKALAEVQEKIGDYFIIPSSIHELILLPYDEYADVSQISRMVREVNDTEVREEEKLSYSVFCYRAESGLSQVA